MKQDSTPEMKVRRITLSDGRYLLFYIFESEDAEHDSAIVSTNEKQLGTSRDGERESRV